jgi:hypothetical protein
MKIFLKYTMILAASVFLVMACRDEDAVRFPELQSGINARVVIDTENSFFNLGNIETTYVQLHIYSENKDIDHITYSATYTSVAAGTTSDTVEIITVQGSDFKGGVVDIQISAADLASKFSLANSTADLGGGDSFVFTTEATLKDGRVYTASNSASSISTGTNSSFTTTFTLNVACPSFEPTDAVGTYTLSSDPGEWGTAANLQVQIVAGPDENQFTIKDALGYPQAFDMIIEVDPATSKVTVAKQTTFDYDFWLPNSYGLGATEGTGTFYSCAGLLNLSLVWSVDAGSFGTYGIGYTKVN